MGSIVKYNAELISIAEELIKQKSDLQDIKAEKDLYIIDTTLNGTNTSVNPYILDNRLRKEYRSIASMEVLAQKFAFDDGRPEHCLLSEGEKIRNRLIADRIGIIADILWRHARIKALDELYVSCDACIGYDSFA